MIRYDVPQIKGITEQKIFCMLNIEAYVCIETFLYISNRFKMASKNPKFSFQKGVHSVSSLFFQVEKFQPIDIQPSDILFEWSLPNTEQNGVIRKFTITYGLEVNFLKLL